ncbi:excalibur calcium-binding domain-containing protein [Nocardia sp. SC052]|uniref:excalibur calcium-binding domain-containing protein n=1 Tax=Nocardia sichangensis TaxID=3385975 RepID=UPI0039A0868F
MAPPPPATLQSPIAPTPPSVTVAPDPPTVAVPTPPVAAVPAPPRPVAPSIFYPNCAAARAAGAAPLRCGEPGYRPELDRDKDGIACE